MGYPGQRIAERRNYLQMSQEELAALLGTTQKQISRYENGRNDPTGEVLIKFARALDTSADWLLGLTDVSERSLRGQGDLDEDERELIMLYREKPPGERQRVMKVLRVL